MCVRRSLKPLTGCARVTAIYKNGTRETRSTATHTPSLNPGPKPAVQRHLRRPLQQRSEVCAVATARLRMPYSSSSAQTFRIPRRQTFRIPRRLAIESDSQTDRAARSRVCAGRVRTRAPAGCASAECVPVCQHSVCQQRCVPKSACQQNARCGPQSVQRISAGY